MQHGVSAAVVAAVPAGLWLCRLAVHAACSCASWLLVPAELDPTQTTHKQTYLEGLAYEKISTLCAQGICLHRGRQVYSAVRHQNLQILQVMHVPLDQFLNHLPLEKGRSDGAVGVWDCVGRPAMETEHASAAGVLMRPAVHASCQV